MDDVIRNLEIIGEAAGYIPLEIQEKYPELAWLEMRGMRNIMVHEYFGVDVEEIWTTVQHDLPKMKQKLAAVIAGLPPDF